MSLHPRRRALLVTGMHRSGTSCVTRIANLTGLAIGTDLLPRRPDNPEGFWEHAELSRLNDEILATLGTSWDALAPLPPNWWQQPELDDVKQALRDVLRRDFADEPDLVVKDPRLCLLVPLWREVLGDLGLSVEFLIVMRDVRAVVASLKQRNLFSPWQSELLWLRYNLTVEYETRDDRRALVHYEELIRDWRAALGKVAGTIALALPDPDSERAQAIDEFVSPELNHSAIERDDGRIAEASPWASEVMRALAEPGALDDADSRASLDHVRTELLAADPLYAPQDRHWRSEFLRLQAEVDTAREAMQQAIVERERIEDALATGLASGGSAEDWRERLDSIANESQSTRRMTERLLGEQSAIGVLSERIEALEAETRRRSETDWQTLVGERDALASRENAIEAARSRLEITLASTIEREQAQSAQLEALTEELAQARRQALEARDEDARRIAELEAEVSHLGMHLENTRNDLTAHREVLGNLMSSRSWRITKPLRGLSTGLARRRTGPLAPGLEHPAPWHELLPGRPFRQRFRSPHNELAGLGIGFFDYGRANQTTVRVRLFEEPGRFRKPRLLEETRLSDADIRDGQTSLFAFAKRIREADSRSLLIEIESLDGQPGESVTVALGQASYPGKILSRDRKGEAPSHGLLVLDMMPSVVIPRKAIAFVSGCPGGAYRYRCEHPAEMFRLRGYAVDVIPADEFPWKQLLVSYQVVIAHRVPYTPEFEAFVSEARQQGVRVLFDTDDLVFAPEIADQIAALDELPQDERDLWLDGVERYRKSLTLVSHALVSTQGLKESLESRLEIEASVARNRVTREMVEAGESARRSRKRRDGLVRIGYMSGTPTHQRDFAECVPALETVLSRHPHVRLVLVGHIEVPKPLLLHSDRIERLPLVPWQELPRLYADMDVSLAPLERNNEFTVGKSELKYFEAGLVEVPTVASRVGAYVDAIRDGSNGFLCGSEAEWTAALERLVEDTGLRERIGASARQDVHQRYTTLAAAGETVDVLIGALGPRASDARPLRVAMVMRAPIANTGGGYKKLFHLVEYLSSKGHDVTVYVEAIAHLEDRSDEEIDAFCREHFDCGGSKIRVGHNAITDCDVAIATNWPTADVVNDLENARLRLYFIQDDEAEFYEKGDPHRQAAAKTYGLPLLMVGIGRYLSGLIGERNGLSYPHVDFALGDAFFECREQTKAKLDRLATMDSPTLLFFARPGIPRRAFDLGVEALTDLHARRPDVEIRLYGLEEHLELPFEYTDLGVIDQAEVAAEMRRAAVHLSFSRTNASTVIFEAMACGAVAVELDVESVRSLIEDRDSCVLCEDSAEAVTRSLVELFDDPERMARIAQAGFESVSDFTVENMCEQFEAILLRYSLADRVPG